MQKNSKAKGRSLEHASHTIEFTQSEMMIGDLDVECMMIAAPFLVTVRTRNLISRFELKNQGRVFKFEPIDDMLPGKCLEINVVQRL